MKIQVIDETSIASADMKTIIDALKYFIPLVTKAWNQPAIQVGTDAGDWKVYLTERNRQNGALGFHKTENGIPVAYISPKACYRLWGHYTKALVVKGITVHGALYTEGLITVICHEIAEMICDPAIQTVSSQDIQGRNWLVEVCDHVYGSYSQSTFNGNVCIFPDVTTPAFYKNGSIAPYSIYHGAPAPFTMTTKGYGYWKDSKGLHKI